MIIILLFLAACPLGTVSSVNNQLIGILGLRDDIAGYLFVQCYRGEKKQLRSILGVIRRQRFILLVFALGGPLTVPRIRDYTLP
jgi:hypothetical protein